MLNKILKKMLHKLKKILSLSARDIKDLTVVWFSLLAVDLRLRALPYSLNRSYIFKQVKVKNPDSLNLSHEARSMASRYAALTAMAANHHILPMTCLRRSLVIRDIIRRMGYDAVIRFGVSTEAGQLPAHRSQKNPAAHAWVQYDGGTIDTYNSSSNFSKFDSEK